MTKNDTDYKYFNLLISNTTNNDMVATYEERKIQPILREMSDYKIGIIRWKVPGFYIPMFAWDANKYWITMRFIDPLTPANNKDYISEVLASDDIKRNGVFTYNSLITCINHTFSVIFDLLTDDEDDPVEHPEFKNITSPPFIVYDEQTKMFSIIITCKDNGRLDFYAPYAPNNATSIAIYFSESLFRLFRSFDSTRTSNFSYVDDGHGNVQKEVKNYLIHINNTVLQPECRLYPGTYYSGTLPNPDAGYIQTTGNYSCLYAWHKMARIIMTTTLPIETEDIGFKGNDNRKMGLPISQSILTDFEVMKSDQNLREPIYYFTNNDKRYVNFASNGPLTEMNLQIFWEFDNSDPIRLVIPPDDEAYVKLQFMKRKKK